MSKAPRRDIVKRSAESLRAAFRPVRAAAAGLLEWEEGTSYGTPALLVRGKLFARLWEDGETLVLRADFDSRDAMLRAQPKIFYLTDHYRDYPAVLVRLATISPTRLAAALSDSWEFVAPKSLVKARNQAAVGAAAPRTRSGQPRRDR